MCGWGQTAPKAEFGDRFLFGNSHVGVADHDEVRCRACGDHCRELVEAPFPCSSARCQVDVRYREIPERRQNTSLRNGRDQRRRLVGLEEGTPHEEGQVSLVRSRVRSQHVVGLDVWHHPWQLLEQNEIRTRFQDLGSDRSLGVLHRPETGRLGRSFEHGHIPREEIE